MSICNKQRSTQQPIIMWSIWCKWSYLNPTVSVLTLVPEFSFLLLELSAQSLISITAWIMNDHRALYKGLCYSCSVLLNRKLFCMPSSSNPVADCLKSHHYLQHHILYIHVLIYLWISFAHAKNGADIRIIWLIYFCAVMKHGWTWKACKQQI